jgi:hypothetical protein
VQGVFSAHQVVGADKTYQPKIMVAMQMANKDVIDFTHTKFHPPQLALGAFATINQKKPLSHIQ